MVTSKLSSRVRTSIIEGRGEVVFFAEQSSATRRADRKRRRFFAMAVVAGIQWEDRFYSGLNPVMPARVASRSHSRTRSRCHASVCVRVRERVGRCRSLAPPRNGRCRCRCLSLSLRLLSFLFPTLSLSPLFPIVFSLPSSFFSLSFCPFPSISAGLLSLLSSGQRLVWVHERGEESFERRKNTRWPDIITRTGRKDRAGGSVNQRGGIFLASITTHCPAARPIPVKKIGLRVGGREISRPCVFITDSISFVLQPSCLVTETGEGGGEKSATTTTTIIITTSKREFIRKMWGNDLFSFPFPSFFLLFWKSLWLEDRARCRDSTIQTSQRKSGEEEEEDGFVLDV